MSEDSQPAAKKHKRAISSETIAILQASLTQMRSVITSLTSNAELAGIVDTEPIEELSRTLATKQDAWFVHIIASALLHNPDAHF